MTLTDRLATAADRSRLRETIGRSIRTARLYGWFEQAFSRASRTSEIVGRWFESSFLADCGRKTAVSVSRWSREARVSASTTAVGDWSRASFLYRWLTAEPEPEVVVIDLRETLTVGPVVAVLDRWLRILAAGAPTSQLRRLWDRLVATVLDAPVHVVSVLVLLATLASTIPAGLFGDLTGTGLGVRLVVAAIALLGVRVRQPWDELRESRAVRLLVAALEPPPPPDSSPQDADDGRADDPESTDSPNRQS